MRLSRRALDAYNAAVKQCGDGAERASLRALSVWLEANPDAEISEVREFCKTLLHTVGTSYGQSAGDAAYALRSLVADGLDIELPDVDYAYEPDPEYVDKTARYQVEKLKAGDPDGFGKAISDAARYFAERGANDTMTNLGEHDAKKLGKRVLFARVPTGATTCPYCLMLASRGFVYSSELNALNANHRNCDCRIVEGFPGMTVEGYDPDAYYDMWKHPEKYENTQEQDSGIEFNLGSIKGADVVRREINNLANEYHTPLLAVSEAPSAMINERMHEAGKAELYTGTTIWLKNGSLQTANHEFGHTLWSSKREDEYKQDGFDEFEKELKKLWRQYRKEQDLSKRISSYSTENIDEFFADGFAAHKTGKGSDKAGDGGDSPYAQSIGELVDKYFKKK